MFRKIVTAGIIALLSLGGAMATSASGASSACTNESPGWLAREQSRKQTYTGSTDPTINPVATRADILTGYADDYVTCGNNLAFRLSGDNVSDVEVRLLRLGAYGTSLASSGYRQVAPTTVLPKVRRQAPPTYEHTTSGAAYKSYGWATTVTFSTDGLTPGVYILQAKNTATGSMTNIPTVLINPRSTASTVVVVDTLTENAYNYGGPYDYDRMYPSSVPQTAPASYAWSSTGVGVSSQGVPTTVYWRETQPALALARPGWAPAAGMKNNGAVLQTKLDQPLIESVERQSMWTMSPRYAVKYVTPLALDRNPALLNSASAIVTGYHNEYTTQRVLDAYMAAVENGAKMLVMGGNEQYWTGRFEAGRGNEPVYLLNKPTVNTDAAYAAGWSLGTGKTRFGPTPERDLMGSEYECIVKGNTTAQRTAATAFRPSTTVGTALPGVIVPPSLNGWFGGEVHSQQGGQALYTSQVACADGSSARAAVTVKSYPSGGKVVTFGTLRGTCQLSPTGRNLCVTVDSNSRLFAQTLLREMTRK